MRNILAKKYIWAPLLLFIYGAAMAMIFGPEQIKAGHQWNLIIFAIADTLIIILAFFFMRKKYRMQNKHR
ncbi:MAG: hypothetical protein K2J15_06495 [Muribaculaceae bacterium]|nr:hypothetical protein [Muribaculaceae bacterium]